MGLPEGLRSTLRHRSIQAKIKPENFLIKQRITRIRQKAVY